MSTRSNTLLAATLAGALIVPVIAQGAVHPEPGKWQHTQTINNSLLPKTRTQTSTDCVTPKQAQLSGQDMLDKMVDSLGKGGHCTVGDKGISGNTLHLTATCRAPQNMGTIHYTIDMNLQDSRHFTTTIESHGKMAGHSFTSTIVSKSHWVGPTCGK